MRVLSLVHWNKLKIIIIYIVHSVLLCLMMKGKITLHEKLQAQDNVFVVTASSLYGAWGFHYLFGNFILYGLWELHHLENCIWSNKSLTDMISSSPLNGFECACLCISWLCIRIWATLRELYSFIKILAVLENGITGNNCTSLLWIWDWNFVIELHLKTKSLARKKNSNVLLLIWRYVYHPTPPKKIKKSDVSKVRFLVNW